ncbi:hypothetical protein GIB67_016518 [Kingdonia uniflora]|uniref:EF-hand domain-containing protein n=1 Tax=Kingdonia uniflora TaxID=39325 RepID=A0A7J7NR04_9MAGN|nr:hypothetical protein GIB67_016518 [Kingdonia uniflora]
MEYVMRRRITIWRNTNKFMYQTCNNEEEKENGVEVVKGKDGAINLTHPGMADSREFSVGIFDALERRRRAESNEDGRITREEVQELIMLSASANKISKLKEQAQEYAFLIMKELDPKNIGYFEVSFEYKILSKDETYLAI